MSAPLNATEITALEDQLRRQWVRLHRWLQDLPPSVARRPSVLEGWTVVELVAHLGRAMDALAATQPTPEGTVPLSLGEYLGTYPERADEIAQVSRDLAAQTADDPLGAVQQRAEAAFAQLATLRAAGPDPVVQARRGPIHLSEMLVSRLVELVVHGDDLVRSVHGDKAPLADASPLEPDAVTTVAQALLEIVVDRGGWSLEVIDETTWIRVATGRVPFSVDAVAAALQPAYTSDSLPDLGTALPIL